jgi:hypothetical protein
MPQKRRVVANLDLPLVDEIHRLYFEKCGSTHGALQYAVARGVELALEELRSGEKNVGNSRKPGLQSRYSVQIDKLTRLLNSNLRVHIEPFLDWAAAWLEKSEAQEIADESSGDPISPEDVARAEALLAGARERSRRIRALAEDAGRNTGDVRSGARDPLRTPKAG